MTDVVFYFVADVIGDIVSGTKFNMIKSGKKHFAAEMLSAGFKPVGYFNPMPWLVAFFMALPGALRPYFRVVEWSRQEIVRRLKVCLNLSMSVQHDSDITLAFQAEPESPDVR